MSGDTVVLTGATGALGSATAKILAAAGNEVFLLARPSPRLDDLAALLRGRGANVHPVPVDLSLQASVRRAASRLQGMVPRVAALVHTAAVFSQQHRATSEGLELMLATN